MCRTTHTHQISLTYTPYLPVNRCDSVPKRCASAILNEGHCSGLHQSTRCANVSLHWYHKGSIVYPVLTADLAMTPYYPTAEGSHAGNIWLMSKCCKNILWFEKKNHIFFQFIMCFILVISFWVDSCNSKSDVHLCCTCLFLLIKILLTMIYNFKNNSGRKLLEI